MCGGHLDLYYQPSSTKCFRIKDLDYDGEVNHYLGRRFDKFYQRSKCVDAEVNYGDIVVSGYQKLEGSLKGGSEKEFYNKLTANLSDVLRGNGVSIPESLKADIESEISLTLYQMDEKNIALEYKRIDLSTSYIDDHLDGCLDETPKSLRVSIGISLITVGGTWSSEKIKKAPRQIVAEHGVGI